MTRSCHPNSKDTQTDTDQYEEKREGIASYLIVEIPTKISAERRGETPPYHKCPENAAQRIAGEKISGCSGTYWSPRAVTETKEDHKGIEHPGRAGILYKEK